MTKIEWTEKSWNPIVGCSIVSPGCHHCYAMRMAKRLLAMGQEKYAGTVDDNGRWTGKINLDEQALTIPLRRKKPTMWFVNSMSDLFHENVSDETIDRIFAVMALCPQHVFQVLTKRPERMREYFGDDDPETSTCVRRRILNVAIDLEGYAPDEQPMLYDRLMLMEDEWPLPNVWLGVSVEDQQRADERIPHLLNTPAAVRWLSCEPLLGPVDLTPPNRRGTNVNTDEWLQELDWIVVGGESGPNARPMHPQWARSIRDQCERRRDMGRPWPLPFFFKQWGRWLPQGQGKVAGSPLKARMDGTGRDVTDLPGLWDDDDECFWCVGKKKAGRVFDGKTHDGMPSINGATESAEDTEKFDQHGMYTK